MNTLRVDPCIKEGVRFIAGTIVRSSAASALSGFTVTPSGYGNLANAARSKFTLATILDEELSDSTGNGMDSAVL
jgi:hypothetical protein